MGNECGFLPSFEIYYMFLALGFTILFGFHWYSKTNLICVEIYTIVKLIEKELLIRGGALWRTD